MENIPEGTGGMWEAGRENTPGDREVMVVVDIVVVVVIVIVVVVVIVVMGRALPAQPGSWSHGSEEL